MVEGAGPPDTFLPRWRQHYARCAFGYWVVFSAGRRYDRGHRTEERNERN